jgi:hypothetical protein
VEERVKGQTPRHTHTTTTTTTTISTTRMATPFEKRDVMPLPCFLLSHFIIAFFFFCLVGGWPYL